MFFIDQVGPVAPRLLGVHLGKKREKLRLMTNNIDSLSEEYICLEEQNCHMKTQMANNGEKTKHLENEIKRLSQENDDLLTTNGKLRRVCTLFEKNIAENAPKMEKTMIQNAHLEEKVERMREIENSWIEFIA